MRYMSKLILHTINRGVKYTTIHVRSIKPKMNNAVIMILKKYNNYSIYKYNYKYQPNKNWHS